MLEISPDIPERIVALVQEMLVAAQQKSSAAGGTKVPDNAAATADSEKAKTVVLNIWDFAGQAVYYTTHQVTRKCLMPESLYLHASLKDNLADFIFSLSFSFFFGGGGVVWVVLFCFVWHAYCALAK